MQRPTKALILGHYHRGILAARKHLFPETCLDNSFNPLARFYPLGSYTPAVPCNWVRMKYSVFVVVGVGIGKGLGSVKETVSAIQELSKRRERELVTTPFLYKESLSRDQLIGFALPIRHLSPGIQYVSTRHNCRSPYYSTPGGLWYPDRFTTTWVCRRPLTSLRVGQWAQRVLSSA